MRTMGLVGLLALVGCSDRPLREGTFGGDGNSDLNSLECDDGSFFAIEGAAEAPPVRVSGTGERRTVNVFACIASPSLDIVGVLEISGTARGTATLEVDFPNPFGPGSTMFDVAGETPVRVRGRIDADIYDEACSDGIDVGFTATGEDVDFTWVMHRNVYSCEPIEFDHIGFEE